MPLRSNPNQELEDLRHAAKTGRMPFDRDGWLNTAFFLNHQYTEWNAELDTIQRIARLPGEENVPRPVVNKIMHFVRTAHHEVLQDRPQPDVLPATDDYGDISDAEVATAWCQWKADPLQLDDFAHTRRAAEWALLCGNGYKKWTYDPVTKKCKITSPSFFEVYLDPYAKTWDDVRYIIHSQFLDVEQVYDTFGVEISSKDASTLDQGKALLLQGMGAAPAVRGVEVHELWMKPSRRHPRGRFAVWTGRQQLVPPQDLPYEFLIRDKLLPFTVTGAIERPDSPYFMSPVTYLRPAQMELNKAHAQALMITENFANPKWWIDDELQLAKLPDGSPGQVLRGTSGTMGLKPEIIPPAQAPSGIYENLNVLEQGMMHIIGQHEVSQAQVPGRVESSKAIELLKESDAGALATLRETMGTSTSRGWYMLLELQREFGTKEEMVQVYSDDGESDVQAWRAGDMKPGYRVRVSQTTSLGRSRVGRQDTVMNLWDRKIIQDPNQALELLEVPTGSAMRYTRIAIRKARSENRRMAKGEPITPNTWDDHATEIREHNVYRMTEEFRGLDTEAKQKFEFHVQKHYDFQKLQIAREAELQMIAQGQPGQPQGPVPPEQQPQTTPPEETGEQ